MRLSLIIHTFVAFIALLFFGLLGVGHGLSLDSILHLPDPVVCVTAAGVGMKRVAASAVLPPTSPRPEPVLE